MMRYEAPCIERIVDPEEIERELLYAGTPISPPGRELR